MKRTAVLLLAAGLAFATCARTGEEAAVVRTEVVDGVTLVHNPAVPLHPDKTVRFEPEMSFATAEEGPGTVFRPGAFAVDGSGNILIYDHSDRAIKMFDASGAFIRTIGRGGEGPGEFRGVTAMTFLPDGRLLTLDGGARRTSLFDAAGEYAGGYAWKTVRTSTALALENAYSATEHVITEDKDVPWLKTRDYEGTETGPALRLVSPVRRVTRKGGDALTTMAVRVPFGACSLLAGDPVRRRLYHCVNDRYLIDVYDESGRLIRKIDRPYKPLPFPVSEREDFVAGIVSGGASQQIKDIYAGLPYPEVKTVAEKMFTDDRGYLWLVTNETRVDGDTELTAHDVFDPDGVYDARVWLEKDMGTWLFAAGKLYRYVEDPETGYKRLNRYKAIWETAGKG